MAHNFSCMKSNSTISNFAMLKIFDVNLNPSKSFCHIDALWFPPLQGWIKCNMDGVAKGSLWKSTCGGIIRYCHANHVLRFSIFLGYESPANAE